MKSLVSKSFLLFGLVGSVGFVIDGGLLALLFNNGINAYLSRAISFPVACLATWLLNRRLVFNVKNASAREKRREYRLYLSVQLGGALINLLIFSFLVSFLSLFTAAPIVPFAIGSLGGLVFNFTGARLLVFRKT